MHRHVTPFLKNVNILLSNYQLRDGTINFIKYIPRILLLKVFSCGLVDKYQLNSY